MVIRLWGWEIIVRCRKQIAPLRGFMRIWEFY